MYLRSVWRRRRGRTLVETAFALPVALLLTIGVVVVGMGVYRYQQVAALAREGARWASVHGGQSYQDYQTNHSLGSSLAPATQALISTKAVKPMAVGLDPSQFTSTNPAVSWDNANEMPTNNGVQNYVHVTVTYKWTPELYIVGPVNLSSTSVMAMQY